jgi:hypothetical protein
MRCGARVSSRTRRAAPCLQERADDEREEREVDRAGVCRVQSLRS